MVVALSKPNIVRLRLNLNNLDEFENTHAFAQTNPVSVSELNRKAKSLLENHLGEVCVEAEIGDLSKPIRDTGTSH